MKKLYPVICSKCGNVLAKPKFTNLPIIYNNEDFEISGDKSKIFNFTDKAVIKRPHPLMDSVFLVNVSCVCGSKTLAGGYKEGRPKTKEAKT